MVVYCGGGGLRYLAIQGGFLEALDLGIGPVKVRQDSPSTGRGRDDMKRVS